jgi:cell division protein FtsI/penicillin-binding protein 2
VGLEKLKSVKKNIIISAVIIVAFMGLIARCFYLQYMRCEDYRRISIHQQRKLDTRKPRRGTIRDCRFRLLAASNKKYSIKAEPRVIKKPELLAGKLSGILDIEPILLYKKITESKNPGCSYLVSDADQHQCNMASKYYGIGVESFWHRFYPAGKYTSHIVGITDTDGLGLAGIELIYNNYLHGKGSSFVYLADSGRRPVRLSEAQGTLEDGAGVILTIDTVIQKITYQALEKTYKDFEAASAVAIVADPKTGAILAMVSLPGFDPTDRNNTPKDHFRNRVVTDEFEPGSIIKPIVAAIALDAKVVNTTQKIDCENGHYSGKGFGRIKEYRNHGYGNLTVGEVLEVSSNIGMAKIGQKLGDKKLYAGMKGFGFGNETGIELNGEADGKVWPLKYWTGYSVTRIPYGHEMTATALQILRGYCILANGGYSVKPYIVHGVFDAEGNVLVHNKPTPPVGYVIKPEVAKWIVEKALVGVVENGTGKRAKLEKWQVFGKTGTADIVRHDAPGYTNQNIASFVAGAPAEDPRIVVLVSVWKPNKALGKGSSGGAVSSPPAAEIIEKTMTYLENKSIEQIAMK